MNYQQATNEQLLNILIHDNQCPKQLLKPIVHESMERGLLKPFVIDAIKKTIGKCNDDYIQMGYIAILNALRTFKEGRAGFIPCLYIPIKRVILTHIRKQKAGKRKAEVISIDQEDFTLPIPSTANTEKIAIDKVMVEFFFKDTTKIDKYIITQRHKGYTFNEIGKVIGISRQGVTKRYNKEIERMRGVVG